MYSLHGSHLLLWQIFPSLLSFQECFHSPGRYSLLFSSVPHLLSSIAFQNQLPFLVHSAVTLTVKLPELQQNRQEKFSLRSAICPLPQEFL